MNIKITFALAVAALAIIHAQSTPAIPKFEAVVIKPCSPNSNSVAVTQSPGRFTINCRTAMDLIRQSYITFANGGILNIPAHAPPIEKGPAWINTDLYTIDAKTEGTPNQGTMFGPMMRALLEDRFQLKLHSETREIPVYDLTVAKSGAKLQPAQQGACRPLDVDHPPPPPVPGQQRVLFCALVSITAAGFDARGVTMADLSRTLRLDRPRDRSDRRHRSIRFSLSLLSRLTRAPATTAASSPARRDSNAPATAHLSRYGRHLRNRPKRLTEIRPETRIRQRPRRISRHRSHRTPVGELEFSRLSTPGWHRFQLVKAV